MTIEKEVKRPARKTTPTKKVEPKKVEEVEEVEIKVVEKKPTVRKKRIEIDRNESIACRSTVNGKLIYVSNRTKAKFLWHEFGDVQFIDMGELLDMRSSYPTFLNNVLIVVDDEEAADYLGLTKKYESLVGLEDLDNFFDYTLQEMEDSIKKLPKGLKSTIASRARQLVESGELDGRNKINLLEEMLQIKLQIFQK